MKILFKVIGSLLVCLVLMLLALRVTGLEPHDRRPGLWLRGKVSAPVADWSFSDQYPNVLVETRTWYGIPHSVTTNCVSYNGQLYLTSTYPPGVKFPGRYWNQNIVRDPRVRVKIGDRLFAFRLSLVTDPAEKDAVLQSKWKKYPDMKRSKSEDVYVFRATPD